VGIEIASLLSKSNKENGVAPLPFFQLVSNGQIWLITVLYVEVRAEHE
jgi:hypothetical protein